MLSLTTMAKIGRNDPCPCGSGKKQKRCCLEAPISVTSKPGASMVMTAAHSSQPFNEGCDCCMNRLNERADRVVDELLAGRLDSAETLCHRFIDDFPGQAEGLDLLSMVFEERGNRERALDLARQASDIAHAKGDYDGETRRLMRERIRALELSA